MKRVAVAAALMAVSLGGACTAQTAHESATSMRQVRNVDGNLQVVEAAIPEPGAGQIRLRVLASSVNPFEMRGLAGTYGPSDVNPVMDEAPRNGPDPMAAMRITPGSDVAGIVDALGEGVTGFAVGDKVFGAARSFGGWADYALTPAEETVAKPDNLTFEEAASIPTVGFAAVRTFNLANPKEGESVAIIGAAGGVGTILTQMTLARGAHVIAVASSRHEDFLSALGADRFVAYDKVDVAQEVKGVDLVINTARGQSDIALAYLREGGRFASIAEEPSEAACNAAGVDCLFRAGRPRSDNGGDAFRMLGDMAGRGALTLNVSSRYPLEQVGAALTELAEGHTQGKIVLDIDPRAQER